MSSEEERNTAVGKVTGLRLPLRLDQPPGNEIDRQSLSHEYITVGFSRFGCATQEWKMGAIRSSRRFSQRMQYLQAGVESGADPLVRGRPPGRPTHARPPILVGVGHQPSAHGVLLDVRSNLLEFALMPDQMVVALLLPKRPSRE